MSRIDEAPEKNSLYPELIAAGGLLEAFRSRLQQHLELELVTPSVGPGAIVCRGKRLVQIRVGKDERIYFVECWSDGIAIGKVRAATIEIAVHTTINWVEKQASVSDMRTQFGLVTSAQGEAVERGDVVGFGWHQAERLADDDVKDLVRAAGRQPKLRQLFPYLSMKRLAFSRVTGYPYTRDCPTARPIGSGFYEVLSPTAQVLGTGDAESAAELLVAHLPPDIGPATAGTADDDTR
jgi:hypothetical protein